LYNSLFKLLELSNDFVSELNKFIKKLEESAIYLMQIFLIFFNIYYIYYIINIMSNTDSSYQWHKSATPGANQCEHPPDGVPKISDVVANIGSMLQNSGAGETCKQAMKTYADALTAEEDAKAGIGLAEAEEKASLAVQASGTDMSQSGCGTYLTSATDTATQSYKMQCVIQACTQTSRTSLNAINSISITTLPLTSMEATAKAKALVEAFNNKTNTINNLTTILNNNNTTQETKNKILSLLDNQIFLDSFTTPIEQLYSRDITLNKVNFKQVSNLKYKLSLNLSTDDQSNLSALSTQVAKAVAENDAKEKLGVGALSPNQKDTISNSIKNYDTTSQSNVNTKVTTVTSDVTNTNTITISAAGNINLDTVNFDQELVSNITATILMNDAIATGLAASSKIVADAVAKNASDTTSEGADALVAALGKANADALKAGSIQTSTIGIIIGVIIGLVAIFFIVRHFMNNSNNNSNNSKKQ